MTAKNTVMTKDDRERNRQMLLGEIKATCEAEHEDRLREAQKKQECRNDLLGQMDYNERCKRESKEEEARMIEKEKEAEKQLEEEKNYLLAHPMNLNWNPRRNKLPDEIKIPCS